VLRAADTALYHAKQQGRDRVVVAEDGMAWEETERAAGRPQARGKSAKDIP
jgi:predicted signal transduction protein with EAL and GGDEF domain